MLLQTTIRMLQQSYYFRCQLLPPIYYRQRLFLEARPDILGIDINAKAEVDTALLLELDGDIPANISTAGAFKNWNTAYTCRQCRLDAVRRCLVSEDGPYEFDDSEFPTTFRN